VRKILYVIITRALASGTRLYVTAVVLF